MATNSNFYRFEFKDKNGYKRRFATAAAMFFAVGQQYPEHTVSFPVPRSEADWSDTTLVTVYPHGKDPVFDAIATLRKCS